MRVPGVHGVWNYDAQRTPAGAATHLASVWADAIGLEKAQVTVAYYAGHLHRGTAQSAGDLDALDGDAAQLVRHWAEMLGAPAEVAHGPATVPLRYLVDWVARQHGLDHAAVRWFVAVFFAEVATYLRHPDSPARIAARSEVSQAITGQKPDVLIAHSLGSVVAYEALCANPDLNVDVLITIGSPLAMPDVVFDRLQPPPITPARPPGVQKWINIADVGDLIAVPRRLGGRFATDLDYEEPIGVFDFHRARNYLALPLLRQLLTEI